MPAVKNLFITTNFYEKSISPNPIRKKKVKAYILDLSKSGMGLAVINRLKKGLIIDIIPGIKLLPKLQAEVIYITKLPRKIYNYRTGVKFINLNQKQKSNLNKFIKNCSKRGSHGNR